MNKQAERVVTCIRTLSSSVELDGTQRCVLHQAAFLSPVSAWRFNRVWNNASGERQEKTTWFKVTCWRKLAETAGEWVKKGQLILVEGEVEARGYIDKDGNAQASLDLTANSFKFLSSRAENEGGAVAAAQMSATADDFPANEDELPF